ncbi:MAG: AI-2E family transporter [Cyanobacteria bacterium P01_H01_bin.74]
MKSNLFNKALGQLETVLASAVPNVLSFAGGTIESFVYGVAGLMLTFYFLLDGHYFKPWVLTFINKEAKPAVAYVLQSFHQVMLSFIKGQVMLGILTGIYMFIVYLGFNVPYALLLAVIFAIAEFIPVLGTYIGVFFGFTVIIFTRDPVTLFWVWFFSYAFQTVKDNILAPKVVGDVMGLHPMVIILALLLCAKVAGFLGILIALPLASSVNVLIKFLKEPKNIKKIDEL